MHESSPTSLLCLSRATILGALTLHRLEYVQYLPLPTALKQYLTLFKVPEDFDTEGDYLGYHVQFSHHPHHRTHRTHPAICTLIKTQVLLKLEVSTSEECSICSIVGRRLQHAHNSDKWAQVSHSGLQRCFMKMANKDLGVTVYVLEFPDVCLKDLILQLSACRISVPEYTVWKAMYDLASAMNYLEQQNLHHELYDPQYIVLMPDGSIKFENMLVYLPSSENMCYQARNYAEKGIYIAPEQWAGSHSSQSAVVWALGCIVYELATLSPAFLLSNFRVRLYQNDTWSAYSAPIHSPLQLSPGLPTPLPQTYSSKLNDTIHQCLVLHPADRPSLTQIQSTAACIMKELEPCSNPPQSLSDLWVLTRKIREKNNS